MHLFRDVLVYRFRECALRTTEGDSERMTVAQIKSVSVTSSGVTARLGWLAARLRRLSPSKWLRAAQSGSERLRAALSQLSRLKLPKVVGSLS
jgi:hypothetical protein